MAAPMPRTRRWNAHGTRRSAHGALRMECWAARRISCGRRRWHWQENACVQLSAARPRLLVDNRNATCTDDDIARLFFLPPRALSGSVTTRQATLWKKWILKEMQGDARVRPVVPATGRERTLVQVRARLLLRQRRRRRITSSFIFGAGLPVPARACLCPLRVGYRHPPAHSGPSSLGPASH